MQPNFSTLEHDNNDSVAAAAAAGDAPAVTTTTAEPNFKPRPSVWQEIAAVPEVQARLQAALKAKQDYSDLLESHRPHTHWREEIAALKHLISTCGDLAVISSAKEKLATLESPSQPHAARAVCENLRQQCKPYHDAVTALIAEGFWQLHIMLESAVIAEASFFDIHDLNYEQTSLSRRVQAAKEQLAETARATQMPLAAPGSQHAPPSAGVFDSVLRLLGVA